jgi:hypothetical protein
LITAAALALVAVNASTTPGSLTFSNTPLLRPEGDSEPAISIASNGTMAVTGLQWLFNPTFYGTHLWTGPFGSTPTFRGLLTDARSGSPRLFSGKHTAGSKNIVYGDGTWIESRDRPFPRPELSHKMLQLPVPFSASAPRIGSHRTNWARLEVD